jgi:hypothetical protein
MSGTIPGDDALVGSGHNPIIHPCKWRTFMTHALHKLLTAAAAAAFLAISPVSAQVTGGPEVVPSQDLDARVSPYKHELRDGFLGAQVPPDYADVGFDPVIGESVPQDVTLAPVPAGIIEASPDLTGYHYFMLPDERIVIVHPEDRVVATIIE